MRSIVEEITVGRKERILTLCSKRGSDFGVATRVDYRTVGKRYQT